MRHAAQIGNDWKSFNTNLKNREYLSFTLPYEETKTCNVPQVSGMYQVHKCIHPLIFIWFLLDHIHGMKRHSYRNSHFNILSNIMIDEKMKIIHTNNSVPSTVLNMASGGWILFILAARHITISASFTRPFCKSQRGDSGITLKVIEHIVL